MAERASREQRVRVALVTLEVLKRSGENMLGEAVRRAPIEEGTLRGSAELAFIVNGERFEGSGAFAGARVAVARLAAAGQLRHIDVEVSFNTVYAARQHEERTWEHPKGGQADYLGSVHRERSARYLRALELAVGRAG